MKTLRRPALSALLLTAGWILVCQASLHGDEIDRRKLFVTSLKGCVGVMTSGGPASGWIVDVDKRLILTCQHVIGAREEVDVLFPQMKDGRLVQDRDWYVKSAPRVKGKVVSADPRRDLALVQVESLPSGAAALPLASTSGQPADNLHLIGNPAASGAMWNYSFGTLRAVYKKRFTYKGTQHEVDALVGETQLPGNPGDSGAAVLSDRGEVLGVHSGGTPDGVQLMSTYIDVLEVRAFLTEPRKAVAKARTFDEFFKRGADNYARGALEEALADYNAAIKLNPGNSEAFRCRAGVYIRKKLYDKAMEDCNEAIRLDPANANAFNERAVCFGARSDFKAAVADYSEAIRLKPDDFMYWNGRAWTYNNLKAHDKALADAAEGIRLNPRSWFAWHERGLAHYSLSFFDKALSDFDQCLKLAPNDAQIFLARSNVHKALGNQTQADADYRRARELKSSLGLPR